MQMVDVSHVLTASPKMAVMIPAFTTAVRYLGLKFKYPMERGFNPFFK